MKLKSGTQIQLTLKRGTTREALCSCKQFTTVCRNGFLPVFHTCPPKMKAEFQYSHLQGKGKGQARSDTKLKLKLASQWLHTAHYSTQALASPRQPARKKSLFPTTKILRKIQQEYLKMKSSWWVFIGLGSGFGWLLGLVSYCLTWMKLLFHQPAAADGIKQPPHKALTVGYKSNLIFVKA